MGRRRVDGNYLKGKSKRLSVPLKDDTMAVLTKAAAKARASLAEIARRILERATKT